MANFNTHTTVSAVVSGVATTVLLISNEAFSLWNLMGYFALGLVGGLLPDLDSDNSIPLRVVFNVLAVVTGFLLIFNLGINAEFSLAELILLWGICFIAFRHGIFTLFARFTVHRGLIHSVPAGIAFALGTVILAAQIFHTSALSAWLSGVFILLGFLVHLILDELSSVDLKGTTLKGSFGSALNLGSLRAPIKSALLYAIAAGLLYLTPSPDPFWEFTAHFYPHSGFSHRLLPDHGWFNIDSFKIS